MRVKVQLDITKPLRRGMKVNSGRNATKWIGFKYERLGDFCYYCGRLGHTDVDCTYQVPVKEGEELVYQYGPFLVASPHKRTYRPFGARERERKLMEQLTAKKHSRPIRRRGYNDPGVIRLGPPGAARKLLFKDSPNREVVTKGVLEEANDLSVTIVTRSQVLSDDVIPTPLLKANQGVDTPPERATDKGTLSLPVPPPPPPPTAPVQKTLTHVTAPPPPVSLVDAPSPSDTPRKTPKKWRKLVRSPSNQGGSEASLVTGISSALKLVEGSKKRGNSYLRKYEDIEMLVYEKKAKTTASVPDLYSPSVAGSGVDQTHEQP